MHPWRLRLERWFTPMARRCPFSPNAISIVALLLNVAAAALFFTHHFLLGILFITIGGLADAFDGIVARVQEKTSRYGDFLDHFCDRVSDILLITGWLLGNGVRIEIVVAVLIGVMLNGYIGTQIEATWHVRNYDSVGRGEFVLALVVYPIVSHILFSLGLQTETFAQLRIAEWMSVLLAIFAVLGIVQRFGLASKLQREGRESA
ncbi:MAG TPA: CDP-alcohol phosphatidyltransferase family protein [Thermoanaerobaculia bacterium]